MLLNSQVERESRPLHPAARPDDRPRRGAAGADGAGRGGRRREVGGAAPLARQAHRPRARSTCWSTPDTAFLELDALAAWDVYDGQAPSAGIVTGIGDRRGPRVRGRRQRRDGEGRHLLPADGQEAPARAGGRRAEPAARASTSSTPAARSCRSRPRSSPTASTSAGSSTTRRACPRRASRRSRSVMGSCTAGGAYVPAMTRRDGDRPRHRDDLHRRPAAREGGDRPGRHRGGARRR